MNPRQIVLAEDKLAEVAHCEVRSTWGEGRVGLLEPLEGAVSQLRVGAYIEHGVEDGCEVCVHRAIAVDRDQRSDASAVP